MAREGDINLKKRRYVVETSFSGYSEMCQPPKILKRVLYLAGDVFFLLPRCFSSSFPLVVQSDLSGGGDAIPVHRSDKVGTPTDSIGLVEEDEVSDAANFELVEDLFFVDLEDGEILVDLEAEGDLDLL